MTAQELVQALGGRWCRSYGMARCPIHEDRTPSLSVRDGCGGVLLVHCHTGCSQEAVIDELRRRGLWSSRHHRHRDIGVDRGRNDSSGDESRNGRNIELARELWRDSRPAPGTPVEKYLRGRGITVPVPASLRFHHGLKHTPTGLDFPTMVAALQGPDGKISGVHRTYLQPGGRGKANVLTPKMSLGKCRGGAVRLATSAHTLAVGEGIESCLSAMQATGTPAWAALSTSGLKAVILPDNVREVVILADGDDAGESAAQQAAERFLTQGREVRIARPPTGKDFNDLLNGAAP